MRDFNAILALTALFQIVVGADPGDPTLAVPAAFFMAFFLMDAVFIRAALNGAEGDEEPPVFRPFRLVPLAVERAGSSRGVDQVFPSSWEKEINELTFLFGCG